MHVSPLDAGTINVNGTPGCSGGYVAGTTVNIEAVAAGLYKFDHWGGGLSGTANPTTLTMNSDKSVTAYFTLKNESVSYKEAKNLLDSSKDLLVIDVSSTSDYDNSHLLCAKNYVWNNGSNNFTTSINDLITYKEYDILLYDQNGTLSDDAADYLVGQGFESIYYMTDSLLDWIAEGYETFTTAEDSDICTSLPPMAYAGADQNVNENETVTLRGQGSDPGGGSVTYNWSHPNSVSLSSTASAQPTFQAPDLNGSDDKLIFHLTVTDNEGDTDTDSVYVNVNWNNAEPTADAGPDQNVAYGAIVTLDGSGSTDPENSIVSYQWSATSGTINPALSNASTISPSLTASSSDGWVIYQLTVTDNGGLTDTDTVKITVSSSGSGGSGSTTLAAPTGLAANAVSYRKIMLRWTDNSPDKNSSFKIERKKKFCSDDTFAWTQIATVQSDEKAKNYEDVGEFEPGMKYSYRVRAYSGSENSEYSNCASILYPMPSAATPSAPVNLVAMYSSASSIDLSWDQWGTTVTKFEIYRDENDSGSWTLLGTTEPDVLTYTDTAAVNSQSTFYSYKVQACGDAGCSPPAYKVGVPAKPTELSAGLNGQEKVVLEWADNSDYERGFEIYRKAGGCNSSSEWEKVKQAGISRETVTDGSAASGTTYAYKIRAYYRSWGIPYVYGYSDWSDCVEIPAP